MRARRIATTSHGRHRPPVVLPGTLGNLDSITLRPQNQASLLAKGIDIEASYQMRLADLKSSWNGNLGVRVVATDTLNLVTNSGIAGPTQILDAAGSGVVPRWGINATITYDLDPIRLALTSRFISAGDISNSTTGPSTLYQCTTDCPNIAGFQTVDSTKMPSYTISNLSGSFKFLDRASSSAEAFLSIDNVFDKDPPLYPSQIAAATYAVTTNATLYDTLGRVFRAGVRFRM